MSPTKETNIEENLYNYFAIFTYLLRVSVVTHFAAQVHQVGNDILLVLSHCPSSCIDLTVTLKIHNYSIYLAGSNQNNVFRWKA